jgi:coproporphyrinogen III oxidase
MTMTFSPSPSAAEAWKMVTGLQRRFADQLSALAGSREFSTVNWLRQDGRCGGGHRLVAPDHSIFNRGSVNVSHVHYSSDPEKKLDSATAISTIIHPLSPHFPSVHIHVSWTEMKSGQGYWRIMADLNPSIADAADKDQFAQALQQAAGNWYSQAAAQGDRYFYIPALGRHRGVTHFYLEQHMTADRAEDARLARAVGETAIDTYGRILSQWLQRNPAITDDDRAKQLAYHTLYLFQVLTLDRGTTSGLLVHTENDVGILGSIPARVNRDLLASWEDKVPPVNKSLVRSLVECLPPTGEVNDQEKAAMAQVVRTHFTRHPEALDMQARGDTLPPTVANHKGS